MEKKQLATVLVDFNSLGSAEDWINMLGMIDAERQELKC